MHQAANPRDRAKSAQRRLRASPWSELRCVTAEYHDGILVLRGRVSSYYHKQLAQETVRRVLGAEAINNVVEVLDGAIDS
jgi:osmotically-inducible protein OsmY